jgi:3-hydroxybutyrate dehydrogenase
VGDIAQPRGEVLNLLSRLRREVGLTYVIIISPGWVDTPQGRGGVLQQMRLEGFDDEREFRARIVEGIPQKRFIQPSEIGAVAAFLCRDEAFAITMQDLTVSAGTLW